jgi:hypothetical protein
MLIDSWMPHFDFDEVHSIDIDASPEATYEALLTSDLGQSTIVRLLMAVRSLPSMLRWRRGPRLRMTLGDTARAGFTLLSQDPPREVLLGIQGKFWKLRPDNCDSRPAEFALPVPEGVARAVWNFSISGVAPGKSRLTTETRILCSDERSRRLFSRYWRFIRPGSALIRMAILRGVAQNARRVP